MNYRFLSVAYTELVEIARYYDEHRPGQGDNFLDAIDEALDVLMRYPEAGGAAATKYRQYRVSGFPYNLVYEIDCDSLSIVAVAHHRRRPGYWKKRV